jgi:hypothetical protein
MNTACVLIVNRTNLLSICTHSFLSWVRFVTCSLSIHVLFPHSLLSMCRFLITRLRLRLLALALSKAFVFMVFQSNPKFVTPLAVIGMSWVQISAQKHSIKHSIITVMFMVLHSPSRKITESYFELDYNRFLPLIHRWRKYLTSWYISNFTLHNDLRIPYVAEVIRTCPKNHKNRTAQNNNQLIRDLFN